MSTIKWETADHMMNVLAFSVLTSAADTNTPIGVDEAIKFAQEMFERYCNTFGITNVEEE